MLSTILISSVLGLAIVGIICSLIKGGRSGQCGCGCSNCQNAAICHSKKR